MSKYLRQRLESIADSIDRKRANRIESTPAFLGEVLNGGSMPSGPDAFYLVEPVQVDGSPQEGALASIVPAVGSQIPVVVIGSVPAVGDMLTCYSVGGRWVAYRPNSLHYCNPLCAACSGSRYSVNGTVNDPINGTQPIIYDYAYGAWYSAWLPFTSDHILTSGAGQDPCSVGTGKGYYFHKLGCSPDGTRQIVASLFLPGQTCHVAHGFGNTNVDAFASNAYFGYPGPAYPALLGSPIGTIISGFSIPSSGSPTGCDPMAYVASFAGASLPFTSATYSIPKWTPTPYSWTCVTPCPLPRKNLTVSWTGPIGAGSATLLYNATTKDWTSACAGGLSVRLRIET